MDRLNCKVTGNQPQQESSISTQQLPVAKKVTQPKQLTCSIGPIWKPNFGRDSGYFSAKAFSSDPKTSCKVASAKCEAYAQAAAAGAQAAPNTQNPTSYSANCNTFGTIIQSTDCTVRPNTGGGGFVGGLAQGLASGLQTLAAKRGSMMSVFRSCMADEGFALTEK